MASSASALDEYRIPPVFHADSGNIVHSKDQLDVTRANGQSGGGGKTGWKQEKKLGSGAFASVWRERNEMTGELRAVKLISKDSLHICNIDYLDELGVMVALKDCSEFVSLIGWFEDTDHIYAAMEYVEHGDLLQYLEAYPAKAKSEAKCIARQILKAVVVLHDKDILHRDLKPNNILIASLAPMRIKIADFGLSTQDLSSPIPYACGTIRYQGPEQVRFLDPKLTPQVRSRYPKAGDMWAVGIIIYQMITTKHPFFLPKAGETPSKMNGSWGITTVNLTILREYCNGTPFPTDDLRINNVSSQGIGLLKRMLRVDPKYRVSARDALEDEWFIDQKPVSNSRDWIWIRDGDAPERMSNWTFVEDGVEIC